MRSHLWKSLAALSCLVPAVLSAALTEITSFGTNPTGTRMFVYIPNNVASNPALIVAAHYCTGTAAAYYSGTQYATLAETYGYIVIYPQAPDSGGCWDVHTNATLTHDSGGDSLGIASMVRYAISNYNVDASRVFITGTSSGAMMTNVLAGAYPDLFAAGAAFSGVPFGCFAGPDLWNSQCATGSLIQTAQVWGDLARAGYPGYTGKRPKLQLWHGTADFTLAYQNLIEANKQWPNVFGISFSHNNTNTPIANYTQMIFGDGTQYVAYSAYNVGHTVPVFEQEVLTWFGIIGGSGSSSSTTATTTTTKSTTLTTTTSSATTTTTGGTIAKWGQCGGIGWTGTGTCVSGTTCTVLNAYYYQCL